MFTPTDQQAIGRAQSLHQAGRNAEAHLLLAPIAPRHPRHPELQMLAGMVASAAGARPAALEAFRRAAAARPGDPAIANILANELSEAGHHDEALAQFDRLFQRHPQFLDAAINRTLSAQAAGDLDRALAASEQALQRFPGNPRLLAIRGTVLKNLDRPEAALEALDRAVAGDPRRALTHFHRGVTLRALERNADAEEAFAKAEALGLRSPELDAARAAALVEIGEIERAEALYEAAFAGGAAEAGAGLARLRREYRDAADPFAHFAARAAAAPSLARSWHEWLAALLRYRAFSALREVASDAAQHHPADPAIAAIDAYAEGIAGDRANGIDRLRTLSEGAPDDAGLHLSLAELLVGAGDFAAAETHALAATRLAPRDQSGWAWLGTIWRLRDDPREQWLCDYERLVVPVQIESQPGREDAAAYAACVAATLHALHTTRHAPGDQSLRHGTQTSGALFARRDPVIRGFRDAVMRAAEAVAEALPADPEHPFLSRASRDLRFAGSWSVRLRGGSGHHVPHFHGEGWISSAYYAELPAEMHEAAPGDTAGHLQFGSPPSDLGLDLPPRRIVRPETGLLVLFPSYLWHGTLPFPGDGVRLTAAFDIVPVKG